MEVTNMEESEEEGMEINVTKGKLLREARNMLVSATAPMFRNMIKKKFIRLLKLNW